MAQLAIQGHSTRGKEVIEILKMLGGYNIVYNYLGETVCNYYYIGSYNAISCIHKEKIDISFVTFKLEEFIEKFPYKVGDKVNYIKYNDEDSSVYTIKGMRWTGVTIEYLLDSSGFSALTKDLQPYKEETMEDKSNILQQLKEYFENTPREVIEKEWHEYDKYNEIGPDVIEYLEYVNNIRQPKYPKTYVECWYLLKHDPNFDKVEGYKSDILSVLQQLIICRDAYWKIAGEQMGLDKPWEPDWLNTEQDKFVLYTHNNVICSNRFVLGNNVLAFPTEEMRDAFYENFKDLIEQCKKLL